MSPVTVKFSRAQLDYLAEAVAARLTSVPAISVAQPGADERANQAVAAVVKHGGFRRHEVLGPGRRMPGTFGRMAAMWLMRAVWGVPYAQIARCFGKKDHGTAMAADRTVEDSRATDPAIRRWTDQAREWVSEQSLKRNSLTS